MGIPFRQVSELAPMSFASISRAASATRSCLMLEPLFRCNLACNGCGKIDYPDAILNQRISIEDAWPRSTNAAHRWCHRRRRTAAAQGNAADREGHHRAQEVRLSLHERAADGKEDGRLRAESVLRLVGSPRRRQAGARPFGLARRRVRQGGRGDQGSEAPWFPREHQLHAVQRRATRSASRISSTRSAPWASTASRCRRVMRTSARRTSSTS